MLHACAGVALQRTFYAAPYSIVHTSLMEVLRYLRPRFHDPTYNARIGEEEFDDCVTSDHDAPVLTVVPPLPVSVFTELPQDRATGFLRVLEENQRVFTEAVHDMTGSRGPNRQSEDVAAEPSSSFTIPQPTSTGLTNTPDPGPAPMIYIPRVRPEYTTLPNTELMETPVSMDVATASMEGSSEDEDYQSLEGAVGPSAVISPPGSVDSPCKDTACPAEPEELHFTPETLEGPPPPGDSLALFPGASAVPFPEEQRIAVPGFPGLAPAVFGLMSRMDGLEDLAIHQQHMLNRGSYDRGVMRRSLGILAEFAGVDMEKPGCGCQHPGKC